MFKEFSIGGVQIEKPALAAPLAGVSDLAFRTLALKFGAGMVYTEMVSARGLVTGQGRTLEYVRRGAGEKPFGIQLFGSDPETLSAAAAIAAGFADVIDLNAGCPVRKVVKTSSGAALLRDLANLRKIVSGMTACAGCPVTVKIRTGWSPDTLVHREAAKIAEGEGAAAITVHARTASQGYAGTADWTKIAEVKQTVAIPVIGNGDVRSGADALRMMDETGCDAVMIGRAALGAPWIFEECNAVIAGHPAPSARGPNEIKEVLVRHYDMLCGLYGAARASRIVRKHAAWYSRGLIGAARFRERLAEIEDRGSFLALVESSVFL